MKLLKRGFLLIWIICNNASKLEFRCLEVFKLGQYLRIGEKIMGKVVLWGCGEGFHKILEIFPCLPNYVDLFVDSNPWFISATRKG